MNFAKLFSLAALVVAFGGLRFSFEVQGQIVPILKPGDPIVAIDLDDVTSRSSYPPSESPGNAVDLNPNSKYLNFAGPNSGFIVTPLSSATVRSIQLTTANDEPGRDPASWALYGTSDLVRSLDNSDGRAENWTLIDSGTVSLPDTRLTPGPIISINNSTAYSSYRLVFPSLKAGPYMQVAEVALFEDAAGEGLSISYNVIAPVIAIHLPTSQSRYPIAEGPQKALDGNPLTKYLNFGSLNSGFIVTPTLGPSVVKYFQFTTANDEYLRDPYSWALYGTDDPIQSSDNSGGREENWTLIDSGIAPLPFERLTPGDLVLLDNDRSYTSYRMVITGTFYQVLEPGKEYDAVQYSEIQFFGVVGQKDCRNCFGGTVSWWPGGENGNDIVGGHNGILQNGATFAAGKVGTGFSLDGVDDRVVVPDLAPNLPENEITVEFWQKVNAVANQSTFSLSAFDSTAVFNAHVPYGNGRVYWDFGDINNGGRLEYLPPESLVGSWQHFALVASQRQNVMRIYRNGIEEAAKVGMTPFRGSGDLLIGGLSFVPFGGVIDELSIYNRALPPEEIQAIYSAGSAGKHVVPPAITSITKRANTVTLSWQSQSGLLYRTQYKTDLAAVPWLDLPGDMTASGATASMMDILATGEQRFYRVGMFR